MLSVILLAALSGGPAKCNNELDTTSSTPAQRGPVRGAPGALIKLPQPVGEEETYPVRISVHYDGHNTHAPTHLHTCLHA